MQFGIGKVSNSCLHINFFRGGSRNAATSKMECFVIIVKEFQPLTIIIKRFILDVAAALDPPLLFNSGRPTTLFKFHKMSCFKSNRQ